jgi:hypothetical protein
LCSENTTILLLEEVRSKDGIIISHWCVDVLSSRQPEKVENCKTNSAKSSSFSKLTFEEIVVLRAFRSGRGRLTAWPNSPQDVKYQGRQTRRVTVVNIVNVSPWDTVRDFHFDLPQQRHDLLRLVLLIDMTGLPPRILSHLTWYKNPRSGQFAGPLVARWRIIPDSASKCHGWGGNSRRLLWRVADASSGSWATNHVATSIKGSAAQMASRLILQISQRQTDCGALDTICLSCQVRRTWDPGPSLIRRAHLSSAGSDRGQRLTPGRTGGW